MNSYTLAVAARRAARYIEYKQELQSYHDYSCFALEYALLKLFATAEVLALCFFAAAVETGDA